MYAVEIPDLSKGQPPRAPDIPNKYTIYEEMSYVFFARTRKHALGPCQPLVFRLAQVKMVLCYQPDKYLDLVRDLCTLNNGGYYA